jgi:hypothetical protein
LWLTDFFDAIKWIKAQAQHIQLKLRVSFRDFHGRFKNGEDEVTEFLNINKVNELEVIEIHSWSFGLNGLNESLKRLKIREC